MLHSEWNSLREEPGIILALDEAQRIFEEEKDLLEPVVVI